MHMHYYRQPLIAIVLNITLMLIALFHVCKHKGDEAIVLPASLFNL